jgi:hypothetical protein
MKYAGIVILFLGLLITAFTGFTLVTSEKVASIGKFEITADKNHNLVWSPLIGVVVMIIGTGVLFMTTRKSR